MYSRGKVFRLNVLAILFCLRIFAESQKTEMAGYILVGSKEHQHDGGQRAINVAAPPPKEFPRNNSRLIMDGEPKHVYLYDPALLNKTAFSACLQNAMKIFSQVIVEQNLDKNKSSEIFSHVRHEYEELHKNLTKSVMTMVKSFEDFYRFISFNGSLNLDEPQVEVSSSGSILVPALMFIICVLISYTGYLYQKVRTLKYKNTHVLLNEES